MVEKKSKVKEMSAEEATKKMVQMVEEQEVSQEQREKTRLIEELEAAEKAGKKVLVEEGVVEEKTEAQIALDNWVPKT